MGGGWWREGGGRLRGEGRREEFLGYMDGTDREDGMDILLLIPGRKDGSMSCALRSWGYILVSTPRGTTDRILLIK